MKNKRWNTDRFYFLKKTRRGLFVLLFLFIILAIFPRLYDNYFYSPPIYNIVLSEIPKEGKKRNKQKNNYTTPKTKFNPNTYTSKQWEAIGLSKKEAATIIHYRQSGGKFSVKSDLKKLYCMTPELYKTLAPKIDLPDKMTYPKIKNNDTSMYAKKRDIDRWDKNTTTPFDVVKPVKINKATEKQLLAIPGIGPFYAKEIMALRKRYGGFISLQQLLDIYNMDDEKLKSISPYLILDAEDVIKMNINTATVEELKKNPWITSDMARSIVYYREHYEHYSRLDQLLLSPYIDAKELKKISPYLRAK